MKTIPTNTNTSSIQRQLSVILFADMVGFTAIMERNEQEGLEKVMRFREVLNEQVPKFNGEINQEYGDGCLLTFNSSINAINCARAIQKSLQTGIKVPLRIGLHLGDIINAEGALFGTSINIASRIESIAAPGSILFSERLKADLTNHPEFNYISIGTHSFKNVKRSMKIYALVEDGICVPSIRQSIEDSIKKGLKLITYQTLSILQLFYL